MHAFYILEFSNNNNRGLCNTTSEVTLAIKISNSEEIKIYNWSNQIKI